MDDLTPERLAKLAEDRKLSEEAKKYRFRMKAAEARAKELSLTIEKLAGLLAVAMEDK